MTKTALDLLPKAQPAKPLPGQRQPRAKREPKPKAAKTPRPVAPERPYHTFELVVPTALYVRAKSKAKSVGDDMAHVGRHILYAALNRDPVGPAPVPEFVPGPTDVKRKYQFENLAYEPLVIPNVAKTRDNTRGPGAPYKNYRFRVPIAEYHRIRNAIVGVPGQTVTHVLEAGLQHFVATGSY